MKQVAATVAVAFCGLAAALPAAVFWTVLGIPTRLMQLFHLRRTKACAWALTFGAVFGAFVTLARPSLGGGQAAGGALLLACGFVTGMIAASLSEMLELLPRLIFQFRLRRGTRALCLSFALGKAAGALLASLKLLF